MSNTDRKPTYYNWLGWRYAYKKIERNIVELNINRAENVEQAKQEVNQGVSDARSGYERDKYRCIK